MSRDWQTEMRPSILFETVTNRPPTSTSSPDLRMPDNLPFAPGSASRTFWLKTMTESGG
jgi:hypothetical protein